MLDKILKNIKNYQKQISFNIIYTLLKEIEYI